MMTQTSEMTPFGMTVTEGLTPSEAVAAHLNWEPTEAPITATIPDGAGPGIPIRVACPQHKAMVRSDTGKVLGVVGHKFQPITNERLGSICDALLDADSTLITETIGEFSGGRRVAIGMRFPQTWEVAPGDYTEQRLYAFNGHDGSQAFSLLTAENRLVCMNQRPSAEGRAKAAGRMFRIMHNYRQMDAKIEHARLAIGHAFVSFAVMLENARRLASFTIGAELARDYFERCYIATNGKPEGESEIAKMTSRVDQWLATWQDQTHRTVRSVRHTPWDALNVVTEWNDHYRGRGDDRRRVMTGSRVASNLIGASARAKADASEVFAAV